MKKNTRISPEEWAAMTRDDKTAIACGEAKELPKEEAEALREVMRKFEERRRKLYENEDEIEEV